MLPFPSLLYMRSPRSIIFPFICHIFSFIWSNPYPSSISNLLDIGNLTYAVFLSSLVSFSSDQLKSLLSLQFLAWRLRWLLYYNVDVLCFEMNLSIPWDDFEISWIDFNMNMRWVRDDWLLLKVVWIFLTVHSLTLRWLRNYCDDSVFIGDDS